MTDDLIAAIREAGEVPPPPDRDAAFERAMSAVHFPGGRMRRALTMLVAAALLVVPAGVFQTVGGLVDAPGTPDVVRPLDLPEPAANDAAPGVAGQTGGAGTTQADPVTPGDRTNVLDDPQPGLGQDDLGHQGEGTPCGPSEEKSGGRTENRQGPCADD